MKVIKSLSYLIVSGIILFSCDQNKPNEEEQITTEPTVSPAPSEPMDTVVYQIDTANSILKWTGKKVTGQHNGKIKIQNGELKAVGNELIGGNVILNMSSIVNEDLTDKTMNDKLIGHLASEDFFNVSKYPTAQYVITGSNPGEKDEEIVNGKLTIKDKTEELSFPAKIKFDENKISATGKAVMDRTKWDIRYGSGKFFKGLGDKMIYDEIELEFDIVTK